MGPIAPKDPVKKREFFYIMLEKQISSTPMPDGRGICYIYEDGGRLTNSAKIVGNVTDEEQLNMLMSAEGFKKLVYGIGVSVINSTGCDCDFAFQMYGKSDPYVSGTTIRQKVTSDGVEYLIPLNEIDWSDDDDRPGQIRFEFGSNGFLSTVSVCLYLNDGFKAPVFEGIDPVDTSSPAYKAMIARSLISKGDTGRIVKAIDKAKRGEKVTLAFVGGSITQGAGATPINTECYTRKTFEAFTKEFSPSGYAEYVKAGVGGTPSELGLLRYDRDVLRNGAVTPDIVVIEFAVNDAGDETGGDCYEGLIRKALNGPGNPAVILLFAVFADDYNLEDRLIPIGRHYNLPMVSLKAAVTEQFYKTREEGRVIGKNKYFYDVYHPANTGHTIMADSIMNLILAAEADGTSDDKDYSNMPALRSADFENVVLVDKNDNPVGAVIDAGDFTGTDTNVQSVERNMDTTLTPQFPGNWMHEAGAGSAPLKFEAEGSLIMIITKDSASPEDGKADIYADGSFVKTVDPMEVGWVHCNAQVVVRGGERTKHVIEVKMHPGDEGKRFTVLGFGVA